MIFVALGVLALAAFVALGRRPMLAQTPARLAVWAMAAAAVAAGAYDAARGGWLGGSILLTAALWLATSTRGRIRAPVGGMARSEAASMLGVDERAGRDEIEAAYRRLMFRVHPDQGGAPGLAAQLNAARAVLLTPDR